MNRTHADHILLVVAVFLLCVGTGCSSNRRIINPTVERTPTVFESPKAEAVFNEELADRYKSGEADIKQLRGRLSRNAFYNQQVQKVDGDGDGIISDWEAWRYANPKK